MNSATFFFLYVLPVLIAGGVWAAVLLTERRTKNRHRIHPAE